VASTSLELSQKDTADVLPWDNLSFTNNIWKWRSHVNYFCVLKIKPLFSSRISRIFSLHLHIVK
jgi:hypothetical protein